MSDYLFLGSIVFVEYDELSICICIVKIPYRLGIGSLELVDGLVVISHGKYIGTLIAHREYSSDESHLCFVGILELIDHDELISFRETHTHDIVLLDETYSLQYHIREVDKSLFLEARLVCFIYVCE